MFERYIGIDYSGAGGPEECLPQIQVGGSDRGGKPRLISNPRDPRGYWSRSDLAQWLEALLADPVRTIIGIDHGFSFPERYLRENGLDSWPYFLDWFESRWNTRETPLKELLDKDFSYLSNELRLTERWTSSAKSVFLMNGPGTVGRSTHSGIPWLAWLRRRLGARVHFWPFDGLTPATGRSTIVEVYPSIFRNRFQAAIEEEFPTRTLSGDEIDALAVALWLRNTDANEFLPAYFNPPLTPTERATVRREGWILGIA